MKQLKTLKKKTSPVVLFILLLCGAMFYYLYTDYPSKQSTINKKIINLEPEQTLITNGHSWTKGNYQITPLAAFQIHARVLHKKEYSRGREADLSPVDFALGWGPMSDVHILQQNYH